MSVVTAATSLTQRCFAPRREELGVAVGEHANVGDYTAASLRWLESCGKGWLGRPAANEHARGVDAPPTHRPPPRLLILSTHAAAADFGELARQHKVTAPAQLSPVRTASAADILAQWQACNARVWSADMVAPTPVAAAAVSNSSSSSGPAPGGVEVATSSAGSRAGNAVALAVAALVAALELR